MMPDEAKRTPWRAAGARDEILAELWQVKREINRAADYRIDNLVQMAHDAAERIRQQWQQEGRRGE